MIYSKFPALEATVVSEDKEFIPGSFFLDEEGEASVILEDGTESLLIDDVYRQFIDMLNQNKVHLPTILENIPKFNSSLYIDGEIPNTIPTYSVHDIIVEFDNDGTAIKKKISNFTLGKDVSVSNVVKNTKTDLNSFIKDIMHIDISLDNYMDAELSNKKLMVSESGTAIDSVILRLRKMDNPLSEKDESKFVHVILTGKAGWQIANGVEVLLDDTGLFTTAHVTHAVPTDTDDFIYEYDVLPGPASGTLNLVFDEKNSDIYSVVVDGVIYIKHRKFIQQTINTNTIVKNRINVIKSIIMTNNGHISSISIGNLEGASSDINRIYYSKIQMTNRYLDKEEDNVLLGSLKIPSDFTANQDVIINGSFKVSTTSKKFVINTTNTNISDTLITIGSDNDGTAETVGVSVKVYSENNTWTSNILDRSTIVGYGMNLSDISTMVRTARRLTLSKALFEEYTPEYYLYDTELSKTYYVADMYISLDPQDINSILANVSFDKINDVAASKVLRFAHTFTRFTGIPEVHYNITGTFEYKLRDSIQYVEYQDRRSVSTIGTNGEYIINNLHDIDEIRYRLQVKISKEVVDALPTSTNIYFDITPMMLYIGTVLGGTSSLGDLTKYSKRYISDQLSNDYPTITSKSANETDIIMAYDPANGYYSYSTHLIGPAYTAINPEGKTRPVMRMRFEPGFLGFSNAGTKNKLMKIKTQLYITYPTNTSEVIKTTRKNYGIAPSLEKYKCILRPFVATYTEMVNTLGVYSSYTDSYGRVIDESTDTIMNAFDFSTAHALPEIEIPMEVGEEFTTINTTALINMNGFQSNYANTVHYGKNEYGKDKLYFGCYLDIIRVTPDDSLYNSYTDGIYINNTVFEFYEVLHEYRSITNNSVVDPSFYDTPIARYVSDNWTNSMNMLASSIFKKGTGVSSVEVFNSGVSLTLDKSSGVPYSTLKLDYASGIDRRVFHTDITINKLTHNLMKMYLQLGDIDSKFDFPSGEEIELWIGVSYVSVDDLNIATNTGLSVFALADKSSDIYSDGESGYTFGLSPSTSVIDIGDTQTFVSGMESIGESFYTKLKYGESLQKVFYDLNNVSDNSTINIHILVSVPYKLSSSVYDTLNVIIKNLDVRMATDVDYKNFEPADGYFSNYAMVYRKSSDSIEFTETKYDENNNELYIDQLTDIQASLFDGEASTMSALKNPLSIKIAGGNLVGEFEISNTNEFYKKVNLEANVVALDKTGIGGIFDVYSSKYSIIPSDIMYSARSVKAIVLLARRLASLSSTYEYSGNDQLVGTYTVATSKAVRDLNLLVTSVLNKVESEYLTEYAARMATNTYTTNILVKPQMNDYFLQNRMVNIGSVAANKWIAVTIGTTKGERIGGKILILGGRITFLKDLSEKVGGIIGGTIGFAVATVQNVYNGVTKFVNKIFGKNIFKSKGGKGGDPGVNFWLVDTMRSGGTMVYSSNYAYDSENVMTSTVVWSTSTDVTDKEPIQRIYFPFTLETSIFDEYRSLASLQSGHYTGVAEVVSIFELQSSTGAGNWTTLAKFNVIGHTSIVDKYPSADNPYIDVDYTMQHRILKTDYFLRKEPTIVERAFGHTVSERIRGDNGPLYRYVNAKVKYVKYFTPPWSDPTELPYVDNIIMNGFNLQNAQGSMSWSKRGKVRWGSDTCYSGSYSYYSLSSLGSVMPEDSKKIYTHHWETHKSSGFGWNNRYYYHSRQLYKNGAGTYIVNRGQYNLPAGATKVWTYISQYHAFMLATLNHARYRGTFKLKIYIKDVTTSGIIFSTEVAMNDKVFSIPQDGAYLELNIDHRYSYHVELWKTTVLDVDAIIYDSGATAYSNNAIRFPDLQIFLKYTAMM